MKIVLILGLLFITSAAQAGHSCGRSISKITSQKISIKDETPAKWNGKTIVLFAGLSRSSRYFNPHTSLLLKNGFRVIRYDGFNVGDTLAASGALEGITPLKEAASVIEYLNSLQLPARSTYLVGHSLGGATAIEVGAAWNSEALAGVAVTNSLVRYLPDVHQQDNESTLNAMGTAFNMMWNPWAYNPFTAGMVASYTQQMSKVMAEQGMRMAMDKMDLRSNAREFLDHRRADELTGLDIESEVDGVVARMKALEGYSVLPAARRLAQKPGVVLKMAVAQDDKILVPDRAVKELQEALGYPTVEVFEGNHNTPVNHLQEFTDWMRAWK